MYFIIFLLLWINISYADDDKNCRTRCAMCNQKIEQLEKRVKNLKTELELLQNEQQSYDDINEGPHEE